MKSTKQLVKIMKIPGVQEGKNRFDVLVKIIRDYETGEKYAEIIKDPEFTYYVTKDDVIDQTLEEKGKITHVDRISINDVNPVTIKYSKLLKSIAEETGNDQMFYDCISNKNFKKLKTLHLVPTVHGSDINIEDYYIAKHYAENKFESDFYITKAYYDIEVDSFNITGFPTPELAECPINAISILFEETMTIYTLLLRDPENPLIDEFETQKLKEFKKRIVQKYKDKNLNFKLKIAFFDEEIELIRTFFDLINHFKPDFAEGWNTFKFDNPYIVNRIAVLGYDANEIMCPPELEYAYSELVVDTKSTDPADDGTYFQVNSYTNFIDGYTLFAALRKTDRKRESYELDAVCQEETGEAKYHFKNPSTTIKTACRDDFEEFTEYNIQDVVALYLIENKVKDIDMINTIAVVTNTRIQKAYKKTVSVVNLARIFYKNKGYIMSNNPNTNYDGTNPPSNKKFRGAFVALPTNNNPVGIPINGVNSKFVHKYVIDFDLTSLYPSILLTFNADATTLIGHIESDEFNTSEFANDLVSGCTINFVNKYFDLPLADTIYEDFMKYKEEQKANAK